MRAQAWIGRTVYGRTRLRRLGRIADVAMENLVVTGFVVMRSGFGQRLAVVRREDVGERHGRLTAKTLRPCQAKDRVLGRVVTAEGRPLVVKDLIWDDDTGRLAFCVASDGLARDLLHGRRLLAAQAVAWPAWEEEADGLPKLP